MNKIKYFESETAFRKFLLPQMRRCRAEVFSIVGSNMQKGAYPDVIIDHPRYHGYVEFKGDKTVIRKDQLVQMKNLHETGANVYVVRAPNIIQDHTGKELCKFTQTGLALLMTLGNLSRETS